MDKPPFVTNPQSASSVGPPNYPEQDPHFTQGGAPGGKWPTTGAPRSISGGMPMTTGGFRPSPENPPLPTPVSADGSGKMPGAR